MKEQKSTEIQCIKLFRRALTKLVKSQKIFFCCAIHIRVHIAYRVLLCRTVAYTHTASQIGICYFALTHRIHFFLCRMCALFAWHIACMCIGVCVCALYTILFSNFNGCSVFFTHDFFRFFRRYFCAAFSGLASSFIFSACFHFIYVFVCSIKISDFFFRFLCLFTSLRFASLVCCCTKFFVEWIAVIFYSSINLFVCRSIYLSVVWFHFYFGEYARIRSKKSTRTLARTHTLKDTVKLRYNSRKRETL